MASEPLEVRVRETGVRTVRRALEGVGRAGRRAADSFGLVERRGRRSFRVVSEEANKASRAIFLVRRAVGTILTYTGLRGISRMADQFINLTNQLRTITKGENDLIATRRDLLKVSRQAHSSFEATVLLYTRTTRAVRRLGKAEQDVLKFTKALSQEASLSGASVEEQNNAIRQLTQGLGGAGLKGDELRSVLEQLPTVGARVAESLGVSIGELRKLGEEGTLTAEVVFEAFIGAADEIEERFRRQARLSPSKAWRILTDSIRNYVGEMDEALRISERVSQVILSLSDNIGTVLQDALLLAGAAATMFWRSILRVGFRFGPMGLVIAGFAQLNREIRAATQGTAGLPTVFSMMARTLKDIVTSLARAMGLLKEGMSILQGFDDAAHNLLFMTDDKVVREREELAMKKILEHSTGQKLIERGIIPPDTTPQDMIKRLESQQAPFYREVLPEKGLLDHITGTLTGKDYRKPFKEETPFLTESLPTARALAQKEIIEGIKKENLEMAGTESSLAAALKLEQERVNAADRKLQMEERIKTVLGQIQENADVVGGPEAASLSEGIANNVKKLQESIANIEPGPGLLNLKTILNDIQPALDALQSADALKLENIDLQGQLTATLSKLEEFKTELQESGKEGSEEVIRQVDAAMQEADRLLKAASTESAQAILAIYQQVFAQIGAVAANVAANTGGGAIPATGTRALDEGVTNPYSGESSGVGVERLQQMNQQLEDMNRRLQQVQNTGSSAFSSLGSAGQRAGNTINNIFTNAFSSLEDALVQFVQTGKIDFKQLVNAMIADLARLLIRMLIIQPLMGFFGGIFGGFGGGFGFGFSSGGLVSDVPGVPGFGVGIPGFAQGGLVEGVIQRFARGGQVRGGGTGTSDSIPAYLGKDEFVVNAGSARRNMRALRHLNETGNLPSGGGANAVTYAPNINVSVSGNGGNAEDDGRTIARQIDNKIRVSFQEMLRQEKRPGGLLSETQQELR